MEYQSLSAVEQRINLNYDCLMELVKLVPGQNGEEAKLDLISLIGMMYAEYVTGVYASIDLEKYILEIGQDIDTPISVEPRERKFLIVMSEAGMLGGHSVLVHNWIKWDDGNSYSIVFTDMDEICIPDFIKEVVERSGGEIICLSGGKIEKAQKLAKISLKFQRIILFTHMNDVIPVLAYCKADWKIPVYFYNHADFRFSYGFSVADVVMNLFEFDADKSIRYRGISRDRSVYIQFPNQGVIDRKRKSRNKTELRKIIEEKYGIEEDEKLIVSMGSDYKYENIIGYEFDTYVEELLEQSPVKSAFLIIGAEQKKEKWLRLNERTKGKARALGSLPREEAEQIISASDLYITSFPMLASGRLDADQAGVPSLFLDIIGRYGEHNDIGRAGSIAELIEKSLDILAGNGEKYLHASFSEVWTKQEWQRRWREIYTRFDTHTVHTFHPRRLIEKQEYVNCQLMQERAPGVIYAYMSCQMLDKQTIEELYRLDRKYEMGISYLHMQFLEKQSAQWMQLCEKHLQLYLLSMKWLKICRRGQSVGEYLYSQGYRNVAVYGMGHMGQSLAEELACSCLETVYGIDRNAGTIHSVVPVYVPTDRFEKVDLIINTTLVENEVILEGLGSCDVKMIKFSELLDRIE